MCFLQADFQQRVGATGGPSLAEQLDMSGSTDGGGSGDEDHVEAAGGDDVQETEEEEYQPEYVSGSVPLPANAPTYTPTPKESYTPPQSSSASTRADPWRKFLDM